MFPFGCSLRPGCLDLEPKALDRSSRDATRKSTVAVTQNSDSCLDPVGLRELHSVSGWDPGYWPYRRHCRRIRFHFFVRKRGRPIPIILRCVPTEKKHSQQPRPGAGTDEVEGCRTQPGRWFIGRPNRRAYFSLSASKLHSQNKTMAFAPSSLDVRDPADCVYRWYWQCRLYTPGSTRDLRLDRFRFLASRTTHSRSKSEYWRTVSHECQANR